MERLSKTLYIQYRGLKLHKHTYIEKKAFVGNQFRLNPFTQLHNLAKSMPPPMKTYKPIREAPEQIAMLENRPRQNKYSRASDLQESSVRSNKPIIKKSCIFTPK
jgi:hypothetical protein